MKQSINQYQFRQAFHDCGRGNQFSYEGLSALYEYLIQFEDDMGQEIDLDVIALCCDYVEMTELEIREAYSLEDHESSTHYLENNTFIVGTTDKTVIFQNF